MPYIEYPSTVVDTPLGSVKVTARGVDDVSVSTNRHGEFRHIVTANRIEIDIDAHLERAEQVVYEYEGEAPRTAWKSLVNFEKNWSSDEPRGRGLFWGHDGWGVHYQGDSLTRAGDVFSSPTDAAKAKVRQEVYTAVAEWLNSAAGRDLLALGQRVRLENAISGAESAVEQRRKDLVAAEEELARLVAEKDALD